MSLILNGATGISDVDGTAAAPALTGTDTNTGIFFPAADTIAFAEGGVEAMRIDSSGRLGIGTTSPNRLLSLYATQPVFQITNVASGNTQGTIQYQVSGSTDFVLDNQGSGSGGIISFSQAGSERARIDSSGSLLVGATAVSAQGEKFGATGSGTTVGLFKTTGGATNGWAANFWNNATSGNNLFVEFASETSFTGRGSITYNRAGGLTVYNTTSDERLKQNIVDAPSALSKISSVQIRSFDWKETGNHVDFGVIAQELKEVAPEAVTEGEDNEDSTVKRYWGVDTSALVPALIKAIQEQQALITALTTRITALEAA